MSAHLHGSLIWLRALESLKKGRHTCDGALVDLACCDCVRYGVQGFSVWISNGGVSGSRNRPN